MVGVLIAGRYELEELIGSGGMANVYRAHDRLLDRRVAIKMLHEQFGDDPDYVERFRREARAAAQLSHPSIVTVIDRGESEGRQFIVFEYVEGETLKAYVARSGPLPLKKALELAIEIGRALAFAHEHGLVHRDVKPQNVLLKNGLPKVTDFGIVQMADQGLTQAGTVLGTSDYIAPEQASGLAATESSDVYSLGALLYEVLTGETLFPGDSFVSVAMSHVHDPPPSVLARRPDVSMRLASSVARSLEKDPQRRFPSMQSFVQELRACLAELGPTESQATAIMRAPSAARRRPAPEASGRRLRPLWLVIAGSLAVLAAAGATVYLLERHGGGDGTGPAAAITLKAVSAFDPEGDRREYGDRVGFATDGDAATYWRTERYLTDSFGGLKKGVGIVLDAGRAVRLSELVVQSTTPGFRAVVKAGVAPVGSFTLVSAERQADESTTFSLTPRTEYRYYLLWLTRLPPGEGVARVNEVTVR